MACNPLQSNYPAVRNVNETARLRAQHDLVVHAVRGLILPPAFDTARPNLRILDIGTADGNFLACVRKELEHPDSATLIGTDLAAYPDSAASANGIELVVHDFRNPFPEHWNASFDFVQMRACLANVPGTAAVDVVRRLIELVKPGGWIQLVDGTTGSSTAQAEEVYYAKGKAWTEMFSERLGGFLVKNGLDATAGERAGDILREAGGRDALEEIAERKGSVRIGKGSDARLTDTGIQWLHGSFGTFEAAIVKTGELSEPEYGELKAAVLKQAEEEGIDLFWFAAWGRKK